MTEHRLYRYIFMAKTITRYGISGQCHVKPFEAISMKRLALFPLSIALQGGFLFHHLKSEMERL